MRIGICVGEKSGDVLAAHLMRALKQIYPVATFEGIAGPDMRQEGCEALYDVSDLSVMGVVEVLPKLPKILRIRRHLIKHFIENPPDVFIGVDAPDFNLGLEKKLKKHGIKTVQFVSPSIWAWREKRALTVKKATDLILCLYPFEIPIYERYKTPAVYVGHPMADELPRLNNKAEMRAHLGFDVNAKVVALLPGSRDMEIELLGKLFLDAAEWIHKHNATVQFVLPLAKPNLREKIQAIIDTSTYTFPLKLVDGQSVDAMVASDAVLVASGTATLQAFLLKRPMVVAYRMNAINWWLANRLVSLRHIALPNILAGHALVPEFLQNDATPENCGRAVLDWINHPEKVATLLAKYQPFTERLQRHASLTAAKAIANLLDH